jgi:multiple sugar transport system permease protein
MFPEFLFIIPMYVLYQRLGLYDTQLGLALVYQVFVLPFAIWLLRGFFEDVPVELEDAARIDGCSRFQTLRSIYLPLTAPGIAATAILGGIWIWNELTIALALTFDAAKTVTVAVAGFRGYASIDWGGMTAASIVSIVPMLIFAAIAQRYIVEGLTLGAVK